MQRCLGTGFYLLIVFRHTLWVGRCQRVLVGIDGQGARFHLAEQRSAVFKPQLSGAGVGHIFVIAAFETAEEGFPQAAELSKFVITYSGLLKDHLHGFTLTSGIAGIEAIKRNTFKPLAEITSDANAVFGKR